MSYDGIEPNKDCAGIMKLVGSDKLIIISSQYWLKKGKSGYCYGQLKEKGWLDGLFCEL